MGRSAAVCWWREGPGRQGLTVGRAGWWSARRVRCRVDRAGRRVTARRRFGNRLRALGSGRWSGRLGMPVGRLSRWSGWRGGGSKVHTDLGPRGGCGQGRRRVLVCGRRTGRRWLPVGRVGRWSGSTGGAGWSCILTSDGAVTRGQVAGAGGREADGLLGCRLIPSEGGRVARVGPRGVHTVVGRRGAGGHVRRPGGGGAASGGARSVLPGRRGRVSRGRGRGRR